MRPSPIAATAPAWTAVSARREPVIGWSVSDGVVRNSRGAPTANVIVYAYHTNAEGIYPTARNRHGKLKAWALTDAQGRYLPLRRDGVWRVRRAVRLGRNIPR
jgi:hypothetical protein